MRSLKRFSKRLSLRRLRARRGVALFISLFFVGAIGALALSAIYLTMNAQLLSKSYDKEDNLKYAAEAALAIGKAELNFNPAALPSTSYVSMMSNHQLVAADGQTIPGVTVDLYVGQTGSTTGQFGRFASLVALAHDASSTGFARRLELTQESFAKFAYWTNSEGNNISFGNGDQLFGPVWSNDSLHIMSSGATFHDDVGTAKGIAGVSYGTFMQGYETNQKPINLPSLSSLATLSALAAAGGYSFPSLSTGDAQTVQERIEFIAIDLDGSGDSTKDNDGFFRVYKVNSGSAANISWLRGDWPSTALSNPSSITNCGDWHMTTSGEMMFFPFAAHYNSAATGSNTWFDTLTAVAGVRTIAQARSEADSLDGNNGLSSGNKAIAVSKILSHAGARCYPGGDPHLAAVARKGNASYSTAQQHTGGDDQTFSPTDNFGQWIQYTTTPNAVLVSRTDKNYLYPLYRAYNTGTKGVIYFAGTVGVSGVVRGDVTLYSPHSIIILDDVRYASDPSVSNPAGGNPCHDILGLISGDSTVVADNGINTPQIVKSSGPVYFSFDDSPDTYIQAVVMALGTSFAVENYAGAPQNALACEGGTSGRGCLYLTGGLIQQTRGAVGTSGSGTVTGFTKRYSYDRCAVMNPPPYFPTTGRFLDNRYYELDPVKLSIPNLFSTLSPDK